MVLVAAYASFRSFAVFFLIPFHTCCWSSCYKNGSLSHCYIALLPYVLPLFRSFFITLLPSPNSPSPFPNSLSPSPNFPPPSLNLPSQSPNSPPPSADSPSLLALRHPLLTLHHSFLALHYTLDLSTSPTHS
jgi:hypothetical protein